MSLQRSTPRTVRVRIVALALAVAAHAYLLAPPVCGQAVISKREAVDKSAGDAMPTVEVLLAAADEPSPAMKYALLARPTVTDNAAPHYYRAIILFQHINSREPLGEEDDSLYFSVHGADWLDAAAQGVAPEESRKFFAGQTARIAQIMEELSMASECETCDWGYRLDDRSNIYMLMLPELQQFRSLARLLALKAHIEIEDGQYEDALETLRLGTTLGRDVGRSEILINGLVGIAICKLMHPPIEAMAAVPETPNLYWALTTLPDPVVDLRAALEFEASGFFRMLFPDLPADIEALARPAEYWNVALLEATENLRRMNAAGGLSEPPTARLFVTVSAFVAYPSAREALIGRGLPADEVDAMPAGQVLVLHLHAIANKLRSDFKKHLEIPYHELANHADPLEGLRDSSDPAILILGRLVPAIANCRHTVALQQQSVDILRIQEAIRIYASRNGGRVPKSLEELSKLVPVPVNVMTGEPFPYARQGDKAVLTIPPNRREPEGERRVISIVK